MSNFRPATLRQGLIWIVFAALLPITVISIVQAFYGYNDTRQLELNRLNASAKAVAERQRDPFIIAQYLLMSVADNADVLSFGPGCGPALRSGLRSYAPAVNFVRADATGMVRCSALPFRAGVTLAEEAWWRDGIKKSEITITPPVIGSISKQNVLILMLPIKTADGRQDGSLSTAVGISHLAKNLKDAPESKSGTLAIVSASGDVVAQGRKSLPFKPEIVPSPGGTAMTAQSANGDSWVYTTARLYGPGLFVVYAEPRVDAMGAALAQFRFSTLLPLLSILLASLAIWVGTHQLVVRWLRDLRGEAAQLAEGNLLGDRKKFEQAPEEIAELSADMHRMADVINKRNIELMLALEAKTELTREVHHRVKNNLQIITSLLMLQAARVHEHGAKDVLSQTSARISALSLIHRLLYEDGQGSEQGLVGINLLLSELCSQLRAAHRGTSGVQLICHSAAKAIPVDYAVPLALFVVEAVTNAYRHAFEAGQKGVITMDFSAEGYGAILTISDNGKGFAAGQGIGQMGTELMQAFATQVNGELRLNSAVGEGTQVALVFPLGTANKD